MSVTIVFNNLPKMIAEIPKELEASLLKACEEIRTDYRQNSAIDTSAMRESTYILAPGFDDYDSCTARAKELRRNVEPLPKVNLSNKPGSAMATVAVGQPYAVHVEYGTAKQAAQPAFDPAVEKAAPSFPEGVKVSVAALAKRHGK